MWLKYTKLYFFISVFLIGISIYSLLVWGVKPAVEFTGGSLVEYRFLNNLQNKKFLEEIVEKEVGFVSIANASDNIYIIKLKPINEDKRISLRKRIKENFPDAEELRFETIGPSFGPELIQKTVYAIILASVAILLWVAYQFKSFKFGLSAVLALFHDSFILIGLFSLFGHFWGTEIDFLFITALLTTLSFSVHDTIVVFDRIREIRKNEGGDLYDISNRALSETMVRSLNNSFTIIFMLLALVLLGGQSIKWFAVALLVGTVLGTYSSPFVAVPLLNFINKK